jgi:hypothetical protein
MKRFTNLLCCIALMIAGAGLAISNLKSLPQNTIASATPYYRPTLPIVGNVLPPAYRCELGEKDSTSRATSKDSVNIRDSVRWVTKTRWKTRYRNAAHITHCNTGNEMAAVTPDSLSAKPVNTDMLGREEHPKDNVGTSKVPSIQLTVDGEVVYSRNDNHSGVEGQ